MNKPQKKLPVYSRLLKLYPRTYRERYEKEILLAATDMLDEAPDRKTRLAVRVALLMDLPVNIGKQRLVALSEQGFTQMPSQVKYSGAIAAALLLPFFIALITNSLDNVLFGHTLQSSWMWQRPYIGLWILYFPILALVLATGSYAVYVTKHGMSDGRPLLQRLLDFRHYWPVLFSGVVAFGVLFIIFFHDSGQCWMHAPWYTAGHIRQTLQCTESNRVSFSKIFEATL